ncbi:MAG: S-layer homology domain-containing protein [Clostridia bacterium]|nr:S-layer homology domain-containing protein [Clostridia bacterium]
MKKIISLLLVLATVLSCFMLTVSADEQIVSDEGRLPFEDVKESHWFTPYIKFCYANGIIKGMTEYTVAPNGTLTRAQFVTMLANLEGVDTSTYTVDKFTDVKSGHWYYGAVAWAYSEGVVNGMTDATFVPNGVLTRAQLSVVMNNYMKDKYTVELNENALDGFSDKPKAEYWYYDAMVFAVSAGLLSGNSNGTLAATGNVTRAQAAVIFEAFMKNYFYASCEHSFSEATCTEAPVCSECGLVNGFANGHTLSAYDCVTGGKCTTCEADVAPSTILHSFMSATCTAPRTCRDCGAERGEALGHKWNAATCTAPKTCSECGAKEGNAKGHNWKAATCTEPKICVVCNTKEGSALGHTTTTGTCSRCGKVFSVSDYDKIVNLLKTKGEYDSEFNCYMLLYMDSNGGTAICYYVDEGSITIENARLIGSKGNSDVTMLEINKNGTVYEYLYMFTDNGEYIFAGYGMLDAATFTKNTKEGFSEYEGTLKSVYTDYMNSGLRECLDDVNKILNPYGYSAKQLGFKVY